MARKKKATTDEEPTGQSPPATPGWVDADGRMWTRREHRELDPVDGRPMYAEGMSRPRWLNRANAEVAELLADKPDEDEVEA